MAGDATWLVQTLATMPLLRDLLHSPSGQRVPRDSCRVPWTLRACPTLNLAAYHHYTEKPPRENPKRNLPRVTYRAAVAKEEAPDLPIAKYGSTGCKCRIL